MTMMIVVRSAVDAEGLVGLVDASVDPVLGALRVGLVAPVAVRL